MEGGTATFASAGGPLDVLEGRRRYLSDAAIDDVHELVGAALPS